MSDTHAKKPRTLNRIEVETIRKMYDAGVYASQIEKVYGVSPEDIVVIVTSGFTLPTFKVLPPSINPAVLKDNRGVVVTYIPDEPIVEFNLVTIRPKSVRGGHYHIHFTEYLLVAQGTGVMFTENMVTGEKQTVLLGPGVATKATPGISHRVHAITDITLCAMLTKKWDDSNPPIVQIEEIKNE